MSGFQEFGGGLRMPGLTGAIRTMTITNNGWQLHERIMAITMETITDARKKSVKKKTRQRPGLLCVTAL